MSAGALSGTLTRPAAGFPFPGAVIGAAHSRRLTAAALAVVAVHVAVLAVRPGGVAGNDVAPAAAPVMAVRMLRPTPAVPAAPSEPAAPAVVVATPAASPVAAAPERRPRAEPAQPAPVAPATLARAPAVAPGPAPSTPPEARPAPAVATIEAKGADAPLAAAPDYAFGVRLDPGPRPLADIEPEYPDLVHLREGIVVLRLLISEAGHVDNVAVVRAEPRGIFEQAALDAFSKARFSPGLAAGTPVKSQITVEVQFMPINRGARVSGKTY